MAAALAPAQAETLRFKADLLPVAGSKASGSVVADYDTDSKKLTWSGSYTGVGTYATSASFYGAASGPRRGVVRIQNVDSPFQGSALLSQMQGEGLVGGEWSIVIRTSGFPKGELLGKLVRGN
jgi:hypothetical protein